MSKREMGFGEVQSFFAEGPIFSPNHTSQDQVLHTLLLDGVDADTAIAASEKAASGAWGKGAATSIVEARQPDPDLVEPTLVRDKWFLDLR